MNVFLLSVKAHNEGWGSHCWGTYNMWKQLGCKVIPGQKATIVTQPKLAKYEDKKTGEERQFMRFVGLPVFAFEQVEGKFELPKAEELEGIEDVLTAEQIIEATGAKIKHGGDRACYQPSTDSINLPPKDAFTSSEGYYGTAFHELVHWTGHADRLKRDFTGRFGDESYAFEELVAESGAAMLCVHSGVSPEPRPDHAKYLNSWKKVIKDKPAAAVEALKLAAKAAKYITN